MRNGLLLLIALFIAATALTSGQYGANITPSHVNSTTANSKSSATTVPVSNTTTVNPNTTTTPNVTTTPAPNTTTVNPNTTTTPNVTTTPAPNTTTAAPTSAPVPTPSTKLTVGNYNISDKNGNLCFLAHMAIEIRVNINQVNGTFIVQPHQTNANGSCGENVAEIVLSFNQGNIALKFRNNATSKMVYAETLEYDLTYAFKSGVASTFSGKNESLWLFAAAAGHSYSCKAETVNMGSGVYLDLSSNRIQAYNLKNNNFGTPDLCKADQPDYRVPIAVGVILIILIVIVVLAYLISRKRRTDGYQSL